jgi:hypothetical protein
LQDVQLPLFTTAKSLLLARTTSAMARESTVPVQLVPSLLMLQLHRLPLSHVAVL